MLKWTITKRSDAIDRNVLSHDQDMMQKHRNARRSFGVLTDRIAFAGRVPMSNDAAFNRLSSNHLSNTRRSLGMAILENANYDKENKCVTSTPHPIGDTTESPYTMALRDVSNITPNSTPCRQSNLTTPQTRKRKLTLSPISVGLCKSYATTLPTFDIEYSPCGVKKATFRTLRDLGLAEYKNPGRYFPMYNEEPTTKRCRTNEELAPVDDNISLKSPGRQCLKPPKSENSDQCFNKPNFKRSSLANRIIVKNLLVTAETSSEENQLSLNSSEMGDETLDNMIDAILESAKKETNSITSRAKRSSSMTSMHWKSSSPSYTPADDPATDLYVIEQHLPVQQVRKSCKKTYLSDGINKVNEREVKTPEQNGGRHSETPKADFRQSVNKLMFSSPLETTCLLRRQKAVRRKHCKHELLALQTSRWSTSHLNYFHDDATIRSKTPDVPCSRSPKDQLALVQTPISTAPYILLSETNAMSEQQKQHEHRLLSATDTPSILSTDLQGSSTPTESIENSRKCLSFSPTLSEDSLEKRASVISSTIANSTRANLIPGAGTNFRGTVELCIRFDQRDTLQVHVIRCRDLQRTNTSSTIACNTINAYVKVAITNPPSAAIGNTEFGPFQRTAVHRNSNRPLFDQRFYFSAQPDDDRRIQLAVWHRDRECRRSEFLGCMSFSMQNVFKQDINGSYRLQPQSGLTNPTTPVQDMYDNSQSSVEEIVSVEDIGSSTMALSTGPTAATATVADENNAIYAASDSCINGTNEPLNLSKKALHQRYADENLFLRFLELDPPTDLALSCATSNILVPPTNRRSSVSSSNKPVCASAGRTPFTITKRLTRSEDRGFGFSIVWTHPPRVEKIEQGLSADKAGMLPGDYVVFIEMHNVVTMPEQDVLNLIKTQGNTLLLEIFRRPQQTIGQQSRTYGLRSSLTGPDNISALDGSNMINFTPFNSAFATSDQQTDEAKSTQQATIQFGMARSSTTACSNFSVETAKRKLHLPQVTFSKEVGKGVLV